MLSLYVGLMSRRKLFINLAVILVCGTVAISLPVIASHLQTSADATAHKDYQLTCKFVGSDHHDYCDNYLIWQLELKCGNQIISPWQEIHQSIINNPTLATYDANYLELKTNGFHQIKTTTETPMVVIYDGYRCVLTY